MDVGGVALCRSRDFTSKLRVRNSFRLNGCSAALSMRIEFVRIPFTCESNTVAVSRIILGQWTTELAPKFLPLIARERNLNRATGCADGLRDGARRAGEGTRDGPCDGPGEGPRGRAGGRAARTGRGKGRARGRATSRVKGRANWLGEGPRGRAGGRARDGRRAWPVIYVFKASLKGLLYTLHSMFAHRHYTCIQQSTLIQ